MLNPRILMALTDLPDAETALDMALAALSCARRPYGIRFAIPARFADAVAAAALPQNAIRAGDLKYFEDTAGLAGLAPLLTDETHILRLKGEYGFAEHWDATLLARFAKIGLKNALMTAVLHGEAGEAEACLPAAAGFAGEDALRLGAGLPLVCSAAPVRTLLINPAFLFGGVDFFRNVEVAEDTLSIAAFAANHPVFAMDRAPLWPLMRRPRTALLLKPEPESLPPPVTARFEQHAGVSFAKRTVSLRAQRGLFAVGDGYAQQLPFSMALYNRARRLLRRPDPPAPLVVTAFIDQPEALKPPQTYLMRFSYLMALTHLPLTLYAGGEMERQLRARFPNTLAYPDNALLPRVLLSEGMTPFQLMRRNKLLLLQRAMRAYPSFSHFAWLDADALPHPVCADAFPDFSALMDDRIHLAWVDGEPDGSMLVAPGRLLTLLVREVEARTQFDAAQRKSFGERELLRHLVQKYPDLFTLHPLPQRELLLLTCLEPPLLSAPLAKLVEAPPKPIRVPPSAR